MDDMSPAMRDLFLGGEDEERQDVPAMPQVEQVLQISVASNGSATVVEQAADANGDLYPPVGAEPHHFPNLEQALAFTGRSGQRADGAWVVVLIDGRII
jgi:hypothetical protein